jgi:hypothetical protein
MKKWILYSQLGFLSCVLLFAITGCVSEEADLRTRVYRVGELSCVVGLQAFLTVGLFVLLLWAALLVLRYPVEHLMSIFRNRKVRWLLLGIACLVTLPVMSLIFGYPLEWHDFLLELLIGLGWEFIFRVL